MSTETEDAACGLIRQLTAENTRMEEHIKTLRGELCREIERRRELETALGAFPEDGQGIDLWWREIARKTLDRITGGGR